MKKIMAIFLLLPCLWSCSTENKPQNHLSVSDTTSLPEISDEDEIALEGMAKIRHIMASHTPRKEVHTLENSKNGSWVIAKNGTKLYFPPNCFDIKNSNVPVKIEIQEFYDKTEFIMGNLSTITDNGKLLESGGMLYKK